jgi:NhaP-type Na+/H+ or K+/H+ antiporter
MFELASIIILGILAQWLAWKIKVPAILPLIITGLLVGPVSTYFTAEGTKWIEPIYKESIHHGIFPGEIMFYFVTLSIGIILFEGGLTLKMKEVKGLSTSILRLISVGSFVTFIGAALVVHFLMGLNWPISFLFSSLIIVTGPTVISPILRNLPIKKEVATILKWEGILIDPIGALVAILVFEFIITGTEKNFIMEHALGSFAKIVLIGTSFGFTSAYALAYAIRKKFIPHYLLNVFVLALVLLVFVSSDEIASESGLLAVVIMGMVLGNIGLEELKGILDFKESLSVLLISMLFIFLSANIEIEQLEFLLDWKVVLLFFSITLVIRPIGVFLSTFNSGLKINEKVFISWIGPRGIVAAGIASLFGLRLQGVIEGAEYITPLVFMVVLGTVLINASSAKLVADKLGVSFKKSDGFIIFGANIASRKIAGYIKENSKHVVLVDSNKLAIEHARELDIEAYEEDIYNERFTEDIPVGDIGYLLAMTASSDVNRFAIQNFGPTYGSKGSFRLLSYDEMQLPENKRPTDGLFSCTDDFINLVEVARDYPYIHEEDVESLQDFNNKLEIMSCIKESIPVLVNEGEGGIKVIPSDYDKINFEKKSKLVYLGKKVDFENPPAIVDKSKGES